MRSFGETPGKREDLLNKLVKISETPVKREETPEKGEEPKNFHFFLSGSFSFRLFSILCLEKITKKAMVYSIASSSNLTIRFIFAVNAVKYICRCIANRPLESALRNP